MRLSHSLPLLLLTTCVSCTWIRDQLIPEGVIPNQATRVTEIRTYQQRNVILDTPTADRVFATVLGDKNRCQKSVHDLWKSYIQNVVDGDTGVTTRGSLTITVSQSAWDPAVFVIEGVGDYLAYGGVAYKAEGPKTTGSPPTALPTTSAASAASPPASRSPGEVKPPESTPPTVVASGNMRVVGHYPQTFEELRANVKDATLYGLDGEKGEVTWVDVVLEQLVVREFAPREPRYAASSYLVTRIWLRRIVEDVYTVASSEHEVGVAKEVGTRTYKAFPVGCMRFDDVGDRRKVLDVRVARSELGKKVLVADYPELAKQGLHKVDTTSVPTNVSWALGLVPFCSSRGDLSKVEPSALNKAAREVLPEVRPCKDEEPPPPQPDKVPAGTDDLVKKHGGGAGPKKTRGNSP